MTDRQAAGRKARRRGNEAELRAWKELVDSYVVVVGRSGKTRDEEVDLVAFNRRHVRIISVKSYILPPSERHTHLEQLAAFRTVRLPGITTELWEWNKDKRKFEKEVI